jgi:hypothetical protein
MTMNTKDSIFYQTTKIEGDALAHLTKLIEAAERGEDVGSVAFSRDEQTSRLEQPPASQPQTDLGEDVEPVAFSREVQTSRVAQPPASPTEPAAPASWVALHKRAFKLPPSRTLSAEQGSYETVRVPSSSVLAALSPDLIPPVAADEAADEAADKAADEAAAAPAQTLLDARITPESSILSAAVSPELDLSEEAIDTACAIFDRAETPTQATAALFAAVGQHDTRCALGAEQDAAFAVHDMGEPDPVPAPVPAASRAAWRLVALALLALALTLGAVAAW